MQKSLIILFIIFIALYFVFHKYKESFSYSKSGEEYYIYLNPFQITKKQALENFILGDYYLNLQDTSYAKEYYTKALKYRNSFNEKQYNKIYSDANGLWDYKLDFSIRYANAYELLGEKDSALNSLKNVLTSKQWAFQTEKTFFKLIKQNYKNEDILNEINKSIDNCVKIEKEKCYNCYDCYYCQDYFYTFKGTKIGLSEEEVILSKLNKEQFIKNLKMKYSI